MKIKKILIADTLEILNRLNINIGKDIQNKLNGSLKKQEENWEARPGLEFCEPSISTDEIRRIIDILFDAEASYAPKGLSIESVEDECRGREARNVAKILNEWIMAIR